MPPAPPSPGSHPREEEGRGRRGPGHATPCPRRRPFPGPHLRGSGLAWGTWERGLWEDVDEDEGVAVESRWEGSWPARLAEEGGEGLGVSGL